MKKLAIILVAGALALTLCACSSSGSNTSEASKTASSVSAESKETSAASKDESKDASSQEDSKLQAILEDVKKEITMPADTSDFTEAKMKRTFGIEKDMMEDFAGLYCTDGLRQDQIVYVKAKDEATAEEIEKKLQDNWQSKYNVIKNYSPDQVAIIEAAKVDKDGLYVSLVISEDADRIKEIFKNGIK